MNTHYNWLVLPLVLLFFAACQPNTKTDAPANLADYVSYSGNDLGVSYSPEATVFKLWAPYADAVKVLLYDTDLDGTATDSLNLVSDPVSGVWSLTEKADLLGKYYAFAVQRGGSWTEEFADPYVRAVGRNGKRGQIIDMKATNPEGWDADKAPALASASDIVLYELQIRDFSMDTAGGFVNRARYLAFTEQGTHTADNFSTGIDYLKSLGVTHVHLLPTFDFRSIDESKPWPQPYNWGYDPQNYSVPEGSFATDAAKADVRIREFKQMVKALHANGIRVVMDVVYNHTGLSQNSNFNLMVPGYFYRQDTAGNFSNASGCGNETASERTMVRDFMIQSLQYWMNEYHIDGFRFDLMGIHDIETMNAISDALHAQRPDVFIYGEGWTGGASPLPDDQRALKVNVPKLRAIAAFSDDMRDAVKGHVFDEKSTGFVNGNLDLRESVKFGIVAAGQHPQIDYSKVNYSKAPWAPQPTQCINYVSAHDNHTLWDKLTINSPDADEATRVRMQTLSNTIVLTSQGVPFLHAGVEFLRSKQGDHNSYQSPDSINELNWTMRAKNDAVVQYYRALIALRKAHPAFRMPTNELIQQHLKFIDTPNELIAYTISDNANGDSWKNILVVFNGSAATQTLNLPEGEWKIALDGFGKTAVPTTILKGTAPVSAQSALVLYQE